MPRNWSADEAKIKAQGEKKYTIWKLQQMVNFGLVGKEKINTRELKQYWSELDLDPQRKKTLELLLQD